MPVRIRSFGGPLTWFLRKHFSGTTSKWMLVFAAESYKRVTRKYIAYFMNQKDTPVFANCMIETVNRCNGTCEFCPANTEDESRPFKKMPDEVYYGIIRQLKEMQWKGKLYLSINNEPFLDKRIVRFAEYAKENLPGIQTSLVSNGTLLTPEKMDEMAGIVDEIVINDYSEKYALSGQHKAVYQHVKRNRKRFSGMSVTINRRYRREILATRAGNAPNKPVKNNKVSTPCIYPFLDLLIFPDGQAGMCCNDCLEKSHFGDAAGEPLLEIWNGEKFRKLREAMAGGGRNSYPFCRECDVVDAGEREAYIRSVLKRV